MLSPIAWLLIMIAALWPPTPVEPAPQRVQLLEQSHWVDSVLATMTTDEKIGQLFMMPVYSNKGQEQLSATLNQIKDFHIGAIIFMQGGPVRQIQMVNALQAASDIPLLVGQDAEWGLGMRLDSTWSFPRQLTLGAIKDPTLIYDMGKMVAAHCRRVGVQVNFAPVVDINNNIRNPVINDRSFGENKYNVALRGIQYMKGMQDHGVMACAKHFPGHGDTDVDSHYDLPVINHSKERLDSLELFPFRMLINQGVMSIMSAHLYMPQLEPQKGLPASLSPNVLETILLDELSFGGLVFTDALNMKGASEALQPGELELRALLAGNDMLMFPSDLAKARNRMRQALESGELTMERLDRSVRKILAAKQQVGLTKWTPIDPANVYDDLINPAVQALHRRLVAEAVTLARDDHGWIPLQLMDTLQMAVVEIGGTSAAFRQSVERYKQAAWFSLGKESTGDNLLPRLADYDLVVVSLHGMSRFHRNRFGVTEATGTFLNQLASQQEVALCVMGSPYSLGLFEQIPTVLVGYEDSDISNDIIAQVLFGGLSAKGRLPVTASNKYKYGLGTFSGPPIRLSYGLPEEIGLSSASLQDINNIAIQAIEAHATPGCQVLVARQGKVIFQQNYGHHTYSNQQPVTDTSLYDLASITKVAATTLSLMYLAELGQFDLNLSLSDYMPQLQGTPLQGLPVRDVLTHTAGLTAWIPFYRSTITDSIVDLYYCQVEDDHFCVPVTDGYFMRGDYRDSIMSLIAFSQLEEPGRYRYSDLGFYLFRQIIENMALMPIQSFVEEMFYHPLGLQHLTYLPLEKFSAAQIVPTENDVVFRKQLLQGNVHDPGAAMLGGISGHAGLFGNANDLAVLMQMLLNGGTYGGERFLQREVIYEFTRRQNNRSRRGLGWDKPETDSRRDGPTSKYASPRTFGHTGFTGTCVWADPEYDLIYVFLSNRIHPDQENRKLLRMDVRTRIQDVIYQSVKASQTHTTDLVNQ